MLSRTHEFNHCPQDVGGRRREEFSADGLKARSPVVAASALLVDRRADLQLRQQQ